MFANTHWQMGKELIRDRNTVVEEMSYAKVTKSQANARSVNQNCNSRYEETEPMLRADIRGSVYTAGNLPEE